MSFLSLPEMPQRRHAARRYTLLPLFHHDKMIRLLLFYLKYLKILDIFTDLKRFCCYTFKLHILY